MKEENLMDAKKLIELRKQAEKAVQDMPDGEFKQRARSSQASPKTPMHNLHRVEFLCSRRKAFLRSHNQSARLDPNSALTVGIIQ